MRTSSGTIFRPGQPGYDENRLGLNRAAGESRPACVFAAAGEHDVVAPVRPGGQLRRRPRLTTLKARYDPRNLFRINFNIPPSDEGETR
jgi:hypothetical protein